MDTDLKKKKNRNFKSCTGASYKILIVDDENSIRRAIFLKLKKSLNAECIHLDQARSGSEAIKKLLSASYTLCLIDYVLPDMNGLQVIEIIRDKDCKVPFIAMTAHGNEELAVEIMKQGALDYLVKDQGFLELLPARVGQVINQLETEKRLAEVENALRESGSKYRDLYETAPIGYHELDKEGKILRVNQTEANLLGYHKGELLGQPVFDFMIDAENLRRAFSRKLKKKRPLKGFDCQFKSKDGDLIYVHVEERHVVDESGKVIGIRATLQDITERRSAEEELRHVKEFNESIVQSIQEGIVLENARGIYTFMNPAVEELLGYSRNELIGKHWSENVPSREQKKVKAETAKRLKGKKSKYETKFISKDGKEVPAIVSAIPLFDNGEFCGVLSAITDISERQKIEEERQQLIKKMETEKIRFETILNQLPIGVIIAEAPSGKLIMANEQSNQILRHPFAVSGKVEQYNRDYTGFHLNGHRYAPDEWPLARSILTGEIVESEEVKIVRGDKSDGIISVSSTPVRNGDGQITAAVAVFEDITQKKIIHEKLHILNAALESAANAVLITDHKGKITWLNTAFTSITGYTLSEMLGKTPKVLKSGEHNREFYKELWNTVLAGNVWSGEIINCRKDGVLFIDEMTITPIQNEQGEISHFISIGQDITERRALENQLTQSQKLESIGQLAAGIAHEINTPIQYVGDNTHFMQDAYNDIGTLLNKYNKLYESAKASENFRDSTILEEIKTCAENIDLEYLNEEIPKAVNQSLDGIERVAKIVRSMKEFSHLGAEEKTSIDLNKAIESAITVSRNEWKYVAEMMTEFDQTLPLVSCFPGELNQVILNLIINAAHAIENVVADVKGRILIKTQKLEERVEIRIGDTGAGVPAEIREKIFDPFFTTKEIGKGTGQGLAIAYNVITEKHGGSITFETELSKGTTFIIRLPLQS